MAACDATDSQTVLLRYRNREVTAADLEFLKSQCNTWATRGELVNAICQAWQWRQVNGAPSACACLDMLLRLEERGLLELPGRQRRPCAIRQRFGELPIPPDLIPLAWIDVRDPDVDLRELCVRPIFPEERLGWRVYMERYHYLGDRRIVGEHILYAAFIGSELVALLGWASAALRAPLREEYVGWDEATKRARLHLVVNNVRFLVPPWVRVRHLASKTLALCLRRLSADWQAVWKHPVFLAETFVDTRFRGACYRAANWIYLGQTAGRSKHGNEYLHGGTKKALYVYPLRRHATRWLREGA